MHEKGFGGKDRCCCKTPSQVTKQYCVNKKYMWLVIPDKGEHCCKVDKNSWYCPGTGSKGSYKEVDMSICDSGLEEKVKAECQKVDIVTACERPECKNLQLTIGAGASKRSVPFLNCDGYKPCCGSKDYFKEEYGGKTAYQTAYRYKQECVEHFPRAQCGQLGSKLGMGALDLDCVPLREQCPDQAPRTSSKCPRVPSRGQFKLCCGRTDAYQAKYGKKHQFENYKSCAAAAATQISCALEFGDKAEPCCVPVYKSCPSLLGE